ncbi:MAG: ORF6N domain-containing protein [Bacteroidales bacterium]|nr:ORF6N domain-containing protein [Bacteroidales bacterium]
MDLEDVEIRKLIVYLRGTQVILDRDLARLYQVEVAQMNRQVKRNIERFPEDFMFRITKDEYDGLKCHFGISNLRGGDRSLPYVFTEQGVSMLAGLLRSQIAINANIAIIRAFTAMRRFITYNATYCSRFERLESRQLESELKINELFKILNEKNTYVKQGVFFDGQIYDAYSFIAELIRRADRRIILIDNYIDDTVLTLLDKRKDNIEATIYTSRNISKGTILDIQKHDAQYGNINIHMFDKSHDRFLIIDDNVYLIGASIKDLGKKWFGFTLMESISAEEIIKRL